MKPVQQSPPGHNNDHIMISIAIPTRLVIVLIRGLMTAAMWSLL